MLMLQAFLLIVRISLCYQYFLSLLCSCSIKRPVSSNIQDMLSKQIYLKTSQPVHYMVVICILYTLKHVLC